MEESKISVILPTYDEKDNIIPLIDAIQGHLQGRDFEIIVVDDDSPDLTWKLVETRAAIDNSVKLIHRIGKAELTSALNDGISLSTGDIVMWMDCDFQHPPEKIPELLKAIADGHDAAIASRFGFKDSGDYRVKMKGELPWIIRVHGVLSNFICYMAAVVLRCPFRDWTSGYIAIKRDILIQYKLRGDYGEYFMTLMFQVIRAGYKFVEIPYILDERKRGYSKTATNYVGLFSKGIKYIGTMLRLAFSGAPKANSKAGHLEVKELV